MQSIIWRNKKIETVDARSFMSTKPEECKKYLHAVKQYWKTHKMPPRIDARHKMTGPTAATLAEPCPLETGQQRDQWEHMCGLKSPVKLHMNANTGENN